jgi:hypothetical protein
MEGLMRSDDNEKITPGIYQICFGGMTFGECRRSGGGIIGFILRLFFKLINQRSVYLWLPGFDAERVCDIGEFSEKAIGNLMLLVDRLKEYGYENGQFTKMGINVVKGSTYLGSYYVLNNDCVRFVLIFSFKLNDKPCQIITAGFFTEDMFITDVTTQQSGFDGGDEDNCKTITLPRNTNMNRVLACLDEEFKAVSKPIKKFSSVTDLKQTLDLITNKRDCYNINRGLYKKVSDKEQARVLKEFGYDINEIMGN